MTEGWVSIDKSAEGGPRIFRKVFYLFCFPCHQLQLNFAIKRSICAAIPDLTGDQEIKQT